MSHLNTTTKQALSLSIGHINKLNSRKIEPTTFNL